MKRKLISFALMLLCMKGLASTASAATGTVTLTSHQNGSLLYLPKYIRVSGTFILTEDLTPSGYWRLDNYCQGGTGNYRGDAFTRSSYMNTTQAGGDYAKLYWSVDDGTRRQIGRVYISAYGPSDLGKEQNFSFLLDPKAYELGAPHVLKIYLQDIFGYKCVNNSGYGMNQGYGETIAEQTLTFVYGEPPPAVGV
ncbi:hypothetical protein ACUUL3_07900 [Thiovibrio sp. JS02]